MYRRVGTSVLAGTVVAVALTPFTLPVLSIGVGAVATFVAARRLRAGRHYALIGTAYYLMLSVVVPAITVLPDALVYEGAARYLLGVLGLVSGLVVVVREGIGLVLSWVGGLVGDDGLLAEAWGALSSLAGAAYIIWGLVRAHERTFRSVFVGFAIPVTATVNVLGHTFEFGIVTDGIAVVSLTIFVGLLAVGFHTLQSWHHLLELRHSAPVRRSGEYARSAADRAGETSRQVARTGAERTRTAGEKAGEAGKRAGAAGGRVARLMSRLLGVGGSEPDADG